MPDRSEREIVRAAIHPAIGIARVGDSPDEHFFGPEVTDPAPEPPGFYKDAGGRMKRQAARFRIYGLDAEGHPVAELTDAAHAGDLEVDWTVHLANTKAAWYEFQLALDIPEAAAAPPSNLRNATISGADRAALAIDPGPRSVSGRDAGPAAFDDGEFFGTKVYLGEIATDGDARLMVLGGHGVSASRDGKPATTFANNDGWHDDVADGPVTARVRWQGRELEVAPAWVVVAPPNYGPDVVGWRTMWDILVDAFVRDGRLPFPGRVSFRRHIQPIFLHLVGHQWVNQGFAVQFGADGPNDFARPELLARLASPGAEEQELRRQMFNAFRQPLPKSELPLPWPWIYGDAMNVPADSVRQHVALTDTQYRLLESWAEGDFEADYDPAAEPPRAIGDLPLAAQPAMLDKAALWFCLGDAFHPGCEMTWPVRHGSMYEAPFRFRHRAGPAPDYGPTLTPAIALAPGGPLYGQSAGDITRWMAVPWQTDTASCRSGYEPKYDPYLPTFWPARVPNQVLTEEDWAKAIDPSLPRAERLAAFRRRASWFRFLGKTYQVQINRMVKDFGKMGVVEMREGVAGDPELPPVMGVESEVGFDHTGVPLRRGLVLSDLGVGGDEESAEGQTVAAALVAAAPGLSRETGDEEVLLGDIEKVRRLRPTARRGRRYDDE